MIAAFLMAGGVALVACPGASGMSGAAPDPDFSLMVSPTRLVIEPKAIGDRQSFMVTNKGRLPVDIVVNRTDFTMDRNGKVIFQPSSPYSAVNWVKVSPGDFRLAPGGQQRVAVRLDLPAEPENGEHQVALLFVAPAGPGGGNIKLNRAIGTPLYVTVPGPIDTSVRVHGLSVPEFAMGGPVEFGATVDNLGTVHRDFFGKKSLNVRVDGRDIPFPDFTVLRGASREVTVKWEDPPFMCICHVTVSASGTDGTSSQARTLIIFPVHLLALLAGTAVALYVLVRLVRRRYRKHLLGAARALHEQNRDDLDQNEKV
ncbi:hypothetical protein [Streptosporangium sp. 'caverna']|uniref:hypothetical protein n=1 Tax=Streptosporangium sp. 'caverna' TaxID=2202249 RepID=UPI0013A6A26E|nr:hypothetical protein [Streptosporangium sp. 'caverna']